VIFTTYFRATGPSVRNQLACIIQNSSRGFLTDIGYVTEFLSIRIGDLRRCPISIIPEIICLVTRNRIDIGNRWTVEDSEYWSRF